MNNSTDTGFLPRFSYDPFGMITVGRNWEVGSGYRYGFNGQEQDDEVYGNGNLNTAEFWEYDTRLGRRWNVDPITYSQWSPYLVFAGNPIFFNDIKGDKIIIKGEKCDQFLEYLNKNLKTQFIINESNELVLKNPDDKVVGVFAKLITRAINSNKTITLTLVPQDDTYFADDYATGNVDVDDLLKLDEVSFKSNVLHIVIERIKSKNYDLEKKDSRYDKAHKKALKAETKLLKEYFAVRGIKYRAQGFDIEAMTLDANSNKGTIEYVFDFGSVKQIVVQPIEYEKDGKIVKWQLASDSVVSSSIRVNSEKKLKK